MEKSEYEKELKGAKTIGALYGIAMFVLGCTIGLIIGTALW